ncbi:MAG: pseudouridine synthase, partial [Treponema sp.]|nr:pseudouridine synthase [Treponema sp.]
IVTKRIYRAVAENSKNPLPDSGTISDGLAYNAYNIAFVPDKNSKEKFKTLSAITHYKIIQRGKSYTLFELNLETGRKNQIRCHLASKGYIITGDKNYNSNKNPFSRLALHAKTLSFIHPFTNEKLSFESPEPREWLSFVKNQDETKIHPHKKTSFSKQKKTQNSSSLNSTCGKKLKKMDFIQRGKTLHKH